ncbi:MAG: uroporphyrinogen-III synthase, partial [Chloroflexota bacterium]|nr:uroporphyrinogen-III synthase [Chloroflexota bacterium]
ASAIRGLLRLASTLDRVRARSIPAFCIGSVTAATATRFGFDVAATATEHTALGLADAIADQFI